MSGELLSRADPGTLPYVVTHLKTWLSHQRPGIVWVEYRSAEIRDAAVRQLDPARSIQFDVTRAATRKDWEELREQIERESGIVQVLFSGDLARPDGIRPFAIALNLDRERIFAARSQQIWWLPKDFASKLKSFLPDFLSWVHVRFHLDELPSEQERSLIGLDAERIALTLRDSFPPKLPTGTEPDDLLFRSSELYREGKYDEALALAGEAVYQFRQLSHSNPAILSKLADSLDTLAWIQSAKQQLEQAIASRSEAVAIRRQTLNFDRPRSLSKIAQSLTFLGTLQTEAGRRAEAVASLQEAVDLFRRVADPDRLTLLAFAFSLNNLAVLQLGDGEASGSILTAREAVALCKKQVQDQSCLRQFAFSNEVLAVVEHSIGQNVEALESAQEALRAYRSLATVSPDAFRPELLRSLEIQAEINQALGHDAEAAKLTEEAAQLSSPSLS